MAKKQDGTLVKTAERVGRTLGRAARGVDRVKAAAKQLASGAVRKKASPKTTTRKAARAAKPVASRKTRAQATAAALKAQHGALVDSRALTRSSAGRGWAARNKPH